MITLEHASRWYGQVIGVNDISTRIPVGITALLGPNGAGKSTLLKLVTGQLKPTTGRVTVLDARPFANPKVFRRLGYTPEMENLYDDMTGREFVTFLASLSGIPARERGERTAGAIEMVGMTANADRKIGGYSKGMRQRIKIAQAIVHEPDVLILDEPLNGLDPVGRREMSHLFTDLAAQGKTIVVSSHILYEVEQLTHNILLMHRGRLLAQGDVYQIRSLIDAHPHRIAITTPHARALAKCLLDMPTILSARIDGPRGDRLEIETHAPDVFYDRFPHLVLEHGFSIDAFDSPDNNLEAVFRYLVTEGGQGTRSGGQGVRGRGPARGGAVSIQDFRELRVWQAGIDLVEQVYRLTACFPHEEIYGLTSQLRRAAVSVPANIAEGHTREHTREFLNFLSIGQASLAELETLITISMRLNYVADAEACRLLESVHSLGRQLYSLRNALQARHDETIPTAGPRPLTPDPHD